MKNYFIIDTHCDTVLKMDETNQGIDACGFDFNLDDALKYGGYAQFFATWVDMKTYPSQPFERANSLIMRLKNEIELNKSKIFLSYNADDIQTAFSQNKLGAVLSLEGAEALDGKVENLQHFYNLGIRCISLTWNYKNEFAHGALSRSNKGLTSKGRKLIKEMNRIGIIIDVSHLSEASFWDVLAESKSPVIASHSCAMGERIHKRNLTDEQFKAIAKMGGIVGLNFYSKFLTNKKIAYIDDAIRHFEHFLSLGEEDAIGIGTDFDGASAYPVGLSTTAEIANFLDEMVKKGYSNTLINKFSYQNMLSFMSKVL